MEGKENNKTSKEFIKKNSKHNTSNNINIFCCFKFCSTLFKKIKKCSINISILNQFIIIFVPYTMIISGLIMIIHLYLFSNSLKFDFYTVIKDEILKYTITDLDDINLHLNNKKFSLLFEDFSNLIFFKLYFNELNSYGLFDNDMEKIFPNISNISENYYQSIEFYNTFFAIPKDKSKKYIDERNDSLSELAKIYYHFFPIIESESVSSGSFINQTFLISYEVDTNNEINGNKLYFNFPRIADEFIINNNFYPYNNLIAPRVANLQECGKYNNIDTHSNKDRLNEDITEIYNENWFFYYDCQFRTQNNLNFNVNYFHLNENDKNGLNKTTIIAMHSDLYNNENKRYIINIIYFLGQANLEVGPFKDSIFLISNDTYNNRKYSDNQTYVINNNDITEIALSSQLNQYFHYGFTSKVENFLYQGIYYDNIDINDLCEPSRKFTTIEIFNADLRYFSSFYLYTKLFETSNFSVEFYEVDQINYYIFNDSKQINNVCSKFDFNLYLSILDSNDIDCFDNKNLLYYSKDNLKSFFSKGLSLPYCICLPLYCIKNLEKDFGFFKPEFVNEIILPEKCQNKLLYYNNNLDEFGINKENKINLSNTSLRMWETLDEQLETQFIKFSFEKKNLVKELDLVFISIIDNEEMKTILYNFVENLNVISKNFLYIIIFGSLLMFGLISILIILYIYSVANAINDYKEKAYYYLKKITECEQNNEIKNKSNKELFFSVKKNYEIIPLLSDETDIEDNELINDLYTIYCKFYKLFENDLLEESEDTDIEKHIKKINKLNNGNELFKLFTKLSSYIPKFKLEINIDYDFYNDSKIIKNFEKIFSKKSNNNQDKEQIIYTKSILKELLSTELISEYGMITNINFNYITNIRNMEIDNKNYIQLAILNKIEKMVTERKIIDISKKNNIQNLIVNNIKIVFKNKNLIMKKLEEKFEQDDYLNIGKLESAFNTTLINSFYNYTKKILISEADF